MYPYEQGYECTVYKICNILLDGDSEIFYPCWLVDFPKDFPKTSKSFRKDDFCNYYVAKFKGSKGLKRYVKNTLNFEEEYSNLSFWQKKAVYFSVAPFGRKDVVNFCNRLDLEKSIDDIVKDVVRVSVEECHVEPREVVNMIHGMENRRWIDGAKDLANKVLACLTI